jgi:hypothetical protein
MSLPRYVTRSCDCTAPKGIGYPRPAEPCKCGNRFITEKEKERSVGVGAGRLESPSASSRQPAPGASRVNRTLGADSSTPRRRSKGVSRGKSPKRSEPKRDWSLAQAKVEEEGEFCRVCGAIEVEKAHILGRKYDQPISPDSRTLLVLPDRIVPLCGEWANRCHQRYDAHELDLLPYLTAAEQAQAILDAGSIGLALKRISPVLGPA